MNREIKTINYRPIQSNTQYEVWVCEMLFDAGHRIEVKERDDVHICEITDLQLNWATHRRWLENYLTELNQRVNITNVYFGRVGGNYYPFQRYRKDNLQWPSMKWIDDLHHDLLK